MLIDLRSDTVTKPTAAMRAAMAAAEVGDDVYAEDPTVRRLEEATAELFGRTAAVFVPSGTMGNHICLRLLCPPAEETVCDAAAHIVTYEGGGAAQHGGIQTRTVAGERGLLDPDAVEEQIRPAGWGTVPTRLLAVENTHNRGGGAVYPLERLQALRELADRHGVAYHCDGARIWNASVASGTPLDTYGGLFATLSVCLSKGLGAPVGSLVVCDEERAAEARVLRRRLGGGWRQAGVLAAAGLHALQNHIERLADDHRRARRIADVVGVDAELVETNIVPLSVPNAREFAATCAEHDVLVSVVGPQRVRMVTHLDVADDAVEQAATVVAKVLESGRS